MVMVTMRQEYRTTTQGTEGDSEKSDVENEDEWDDEG